MHFPFQVNETVRQSSQKQPGAHLKIIIASQGTKAPYSGFPSQRLKKITQSQLPLIGGVVDRGLLCDHPSCHWILWLHPPPHTSVDPIDLIKFAEENSFPFRFPIHNKWWAHNRSTKDCSFHFIRDGLGCRLPESLIQLESMMPPRAVSIRHPQQKKKVDDWKWSCLYFITNVPHRLKMMDWYTHFFWSLYCYYFVDQFLSLSV